MTDGPTKLKRASRACDQCHRRGVKCVPVAPDNLAAGCESCIAYGDRCTSERPKKRRGPPKRESNAAQGGSWPATAASSPGLGGAAWTAPSTASSPSIERLLAYYRAIVYPILPLFHWPSLMRRVRNGDHLVDRAFCATVLSACAISACRMQDGATELFSEDESEMKPVASTSTLPPVVDAELFYEEASATVQVGPAKHHHIDNMRACLLLSLVCVQRGDARTMKYWASMYQALGSTEEIMEEQQWPQDLSLAEREERRRMVWCAYQIDVYESTVWGSPIRHRESQIRVEYPCECDDDEIEAASASYPQEDIPTTNENCWVHGWNVVIDVYRVLEYAVMQLRSHHSTTRASALTATLLDGTPNNDAARFIAAIYAVQAKMPEWLTRFDDASSRHIYNLQATNVLMTLQNARIIALCSTGYGVSESIGIARELLSALTQVPSKYLKAVNMPLYHQLAGIGGILAGTTRFSLDSLADLRAVFVSMLELLASLESTRRFSAGTQASLKKHIETLDSFVQMQSQINLESSLDAQQDSATSGLTTLPPLLASANTSPEGFLLSFNDVFLPQFPMSGADLEIDLLFPDLFS